jgi:hypothetical protein
MCQIVDTNKIYSDVSGTYAALVDLGSEPGLVYGNIVAYNNLNQDVILRFDISGKELRVDANEKVIIDSGTFRHKGVIEWKYDSVAPTAGKFRLINW